MTMMSLLTGRAFSSPSPPSVVVLLLLSALLGLQVVKGQRTITLRAGLIANPPENDFQMDILKEIQKFAAVDEGILLQVDVEPLPSGMNYNDAFDLIANDCSEKLAAKKKRQHEQHEKLGDHNETTIITEAETEEDLCSRYDFLIGSYFSNKERYLRADLTPSWLQASITANRYEGERPPSAVFQPPDYYTFEEADKHGGTICVFEGTYYARVIMDRYKNANYHKCHSYDECIEALTRGMCAMYAGNDTLLKYQATQNPALIQTKDEIHKNFMIWPMSYSRMSMETRTLLKGWMYQAVATTAVERFYQIHYALKTCPLGFAGVSCTLPCHPKHGRANVFGKCVCDSIAWEGDDCSMERLEDFHTIPDFQLILAYVMVGINLLAVLYSAGWLYRNRNLPRINIAQPFFLGMILLGCVVSTSTILALMQQSQPYSLSESSEDDDNFNPNRLDLPPRDEVEVDDNIHCMAAPWLYSVGFCITFGTLFAKIRRVHQIFRSSCEMKRVTITIQSTLSDIAVVLLVDIIILTVWSIVSPLQWERTITVRDKYDVPLESVGMCTSDHWTIFVGMIGTFHFVLLGIGCYMCYVTRNVPKRFSGGSSAAMAMFSNFQILLVGVPFMFVANNTNGRFFLQSAMVWLNDLVVIMITFGSLMVAKHYDVNKVSMKTLVKKSLGEYIQNESNEEKIATSRISSSCSMAPMDDSSKRQQHQQRYSYNYNHHHHHHHGSHPSFPLPTQPQNDIIGGDHHRHHWTNNNRNATFDHNTVSSSKRGTSTSSSSTSTSRVSFQGLSSEGTIATTCIAEEDDTEDPPLASTSVDDLNLDYSKLVEEKVPEDSFDDEDDDDAGTNEINTADPTVTSNDWKDDELLCFEETEDHNDAPPRNPSLLREDEDVVENPLPASDGDGLPTTTTTTMTTTTKMLPDDDKVIEQAFYTLASDCSKRSRDGIDDDDDNEDLENPSLPEQSAQYVVCKQDNPEPKQDYEC